MDDNSFKTVHILDILNEKYPYLRYIASIMRDDYMQEIFSSASMQPDDLIVLTFNGLTKDRQFINLMRTALQRLESTYQRPVDVEFAVDILPGYPNTEYRLHVLQCRPLSQRADDRAVKIPKNIPPESILFTSNRLVPDGRAEGVRYIVYVDPNAYYELHDATTKHELARAIGRLNKRLEEESFILMGPGRWGSVNIDLGVHVTYADIFNTKVLIEMSVAHDGLVPELSYGTHFFQDLVEAGIHSLALHLGDDSDSCEFSWNFFEQAPNHLADVLPEDAFLGRYLKVIDLSRLPGNPRLNVLMNGSRDEAVGYLTY